MAGRSHFALTLGFNHALTDSELEHIKMTSGALDIMRVPTMVREAHARAQQLQFLQSSEPTVGRLLSVLSSIVPLGGRVLELGTGAGVGLAWIVHGLRERTDVDVISVELDRERAEIVRDAAWPSWVSFISGNGAELIETLGSFDLIFPDTPGGKVYNLEATIAALRPGGMLLLDDMELPKRGNAARRARIKSVRNQLFRDPRLHCAELAYSSGLILAARGRF